MFSKYDFEKHLEWYWHLIFIHVSIDSYWFCLSNHIFHSRNTHYMLHYPSTYTVLEVLGCSSFLHQVSRWLSPRFIINFLLSLFCCTFLEKYPQGASKERNTPCTLMTNTGKKRLWQQSKEKVNSLRTATTG